MSWITPLSKKSTAFIIFFPRWHEGDTDLAPTGHDLMSDIKNNYIICLNPEGWLGMDSSSPKCHPIMSSGQRYTVRTVPAGTWDAHWLAFYPTAIWTTPVFFVSTAVHDLHPNKKFQYCEVSFYSGNGVIQNTLQHNTLVSYRAKIKQNND